MHGNILLGSILKKRPIRLAPHAVLSLLMLFAGCVNQPDIPDCIDKDDYSSAKTPQSRSLPQECKFLTLETAREVALANNPDFLSAKYSVTAAWARFYSAFSAYLPSANAYYNMTEYQYTPGIDGRNVYDIKGGGIQAQWVIFDGLMTTMNVLSARYQAKQYEALDRDARRLLIYGVTTTYNNVLLSKAQIRIALEDKTFNEELLKEAQIKYDAGAVSLTDPLNFKVKANLAESNLLQAQYNYYINKCILAEFLGLTDGVIPPDVEFPEIDFSVKSFPIDISVYLDTALRNRPDLDAYRQALTSSEYNLWSTYGAFLPTVTAVATPIGYQRTDAGYKGRYHLRPHSEDKLVNYGFQANWVLFSGGQRIANLRQAQALLAQSKLSLTEKWIQVVSEVRQAHENCKQSSAQTLLFKENNDLIKKTRDLVEEEYRAGNTTITRLNEAQRDLIQAETDLVTYQVGLENAIAQLKSATGGE